MTTDLGYRVVTRLCQTPVIGRYLRHRRGRATCRLSQQLVPLIRAQLAADPPTPVGADAPDFAPTGTPAPHRRRVAMTTIIIVLIAAAVAAADITDANRPRHPLHRERLHRLQLLKADAHGRPWAHG
ncbi:hypothetical protein [Actinokineospora sp.]|uniref:hypothetical protein n=1 Tax=Actinokineospora sp. TaxID=1872133 RepID=UPI003D6B7422